MPPVKLSSNESPNAPFATAVAAGAAAVEGANRYPDMAMTALTERLARHVGRDVSEVVVGAGSVAVLAHLLQAYAGPGDQVVFAWRSFEAYPILAAIAGAEAVTVPLDAQARHDLPAMAAAVTDATRVVIVCSPNNPTGPTLRTSELEEFLATVPRRVLVVLDEAYIEYVRDAEVPDGLALLERHPNLLLLRTFSKAWGLAGLRVGYAVGSASLVAPIRACVTPFSVSTPAQEAALAVLDLSEAVLERAAGIVAERERVVAALRADGWSVPDAQGNFVWLGVGEETAALVAHLGARTPAILVRPFMGEGVRVTVGAQSENQALLDALAGWTGARG